MTKKTCEFYSISEILNPSGGEYDDEWFQDIKHLLKNHRGGHETVHALSPATNILLDIEYYWENVGYNQGEEPPENLQEVKDTLRSLGTALIDVES